MPGEETLEEALSRALRALNELRVKAEAAAKAKASQRH
jgi:hypothetical protein